MSGTTLERLQVIIEASATKYKKEMDAVAQKTQKAEAIVDRCMSRVNSIVGKANTGNAGKTVDNLTAKLKRQQEAVDQQGFKSTTCGGSCLIYSLETPEMQPLQIWKRS